ncbi:hypothetical protein ACHAXT_010439 [Thalassiosira profunda]
MVTAKRVKRAAAAEASPVKEEEAEEVVYDKENEENSGGGGGKKKRSKKRLPSDDEEDYEAESNNDELDAGEDEEAPASPSPKRSKKKGANKAATLAASPLADRHVNPTGKPAEAGIISKVYVENFMCHRKLSVDLCRNVNFIHGQNGSGKSAILAAVQVCLGAGARRTHRARNLKDLVRKEAGEGCTGAKLRVTLWNKGADGYLPDVYGDYITVERTISLRSGGFNGYKLLDCTGKEQSRSKKDLDAMLDQLNIQVENPVAVLDQEEAKKFLTGKAEDKYAFFTKATELERLDNCYASIQDNILEQEATGARAKENINGAIENTKKLKQEWEQFQQLDKLEVELQDMRAKFGWSLHEEFDGTLQAELKKEQKFARSLEKRKGELVEAEKTLNVTDDEEIELKNQLTALAEEASEAAEGCSTLKNELSEAKAPLKQKERDRGVLARELAQAKKAHKNAQKRLERARKEVMESQGNAANEERERTRKIAQTEQDLAAAKEKVDPLKEDVQRYLTDYQDVAPSVDNMKETREGTEKQVHAVQQRLKAMQAESGGAGSRALAVFGSKCKPLYEAVQKAVKTNKFKGPVAGPVGMYVKVVPGKEKFAQIAEAAIGPGGLDRFVVTHKDDVTLMNKLRRDVGCGPRECALFKISPKAAKQKYNVPAPPAGVESVTSVLNVENAMAFNFLVDNCNIDTSALTESKESSEQALLVKDGQGRRSIRGGKIRKVFFLPNGDHWEAKAGNLVMVGNDRGLKQTIGVDRSAAIESIKHEMKALHTELTRNKEEEKGVKDAQHKAKVAWNRSKKDYEKVTTAIKKMEQVLDELKAEAEVSEEVPTIDTSEFEQEIEEAEAVMQQLKDKEAAAAQEIETLQPGLAEKQKSLDEMTARNNKILDDIDKVEAKLEDIVKGQTRRQEAVDKVRAKMQQMEQAVEQQEEVVKDAKEKAAEALASARKMQFDYEREVKLCKLKKDNDGEVPEGHELPEEPTDEELAEIEVVEVPKEQAYYKAKIKTKQKKIEQEKERRNLSESDPAVARDKYHRAKKDLQSKIDQIDAITANVNDLTKDLKARQKRWKQFRGHIAEMTNLGFDEFLNKKGSAGEVEFDHEEKQLNLIVQKDNTDEKSQTKDVKALSGGERSFATLSLLLAIGESLETPFRVMDEFDVFLDPVARKIAMQTLTEVALEMKHRQFIFITPQDCSSLKTGPMLKIFKMKAPARNAKVGGPQQQTLDFGSN